MISINIRPAVESELGAAMNLYRSLIGTEGCTWDESYPYEEIVLEGIKEKSLFFAEENGKIIGAAFCGRNDEDLKGIDFWSEDIKNPCSLARIGVSPEYQGKGIASEFIRLFLNEMPRKGYDGMHFLVSRTNRPALALYAKFGFKNAGKCEMFGVKWFCYEKKF